MDGESDCQGLCHEKGCSDGGGEKGMGDPTPHPTL